MGHRHFQSQQAPKHFATGMPASTKCIDLRSRLLQGLQQFFEISRDQFVDDELRIPEWRQADEALERAYEACAAREAIPDIKCLCNLARRYIDMAVEMSTARSYYDGRI